MSMMVHDNGCKSLRVAGVGSGGFQGKRDGLVACEGFARQPGPIEIVLTQRPATGIEPLLVDGTGSHRDGDSLGRSEDRRRRS